VNGHVAARSGEWAQHFSNACFDNCDYAISIMVLNLKDQSAVIFSVKPRPISETFGIYRAAFFLGRMPFVILTEYC